MDYAAPFVSQGSLDDDEFDNRMAVICDPQTSGGLLVALPADAATAFEKAFEQETGRAPARIGRIVEDGACAISFEDGTV